MARALGLEPRTLVLETRSLPLAYARLTDLMYNITK